MGVDGKAGVRRVAKATLQPSFCIFLYMLLFVFSMCICTFACLYICMFGVRVAKAMLQPIFGPDQIPPIRQHTHKPPPTPPRIRSDDTTKVI